MNNKIDEEQLKDYNALPINGKKIAPKCFYCKYDEDGFCKKYNKDRFEVPVNFFKCPSFERGGPFADEEDNTHK